MNYESIQGWKFDGIRKIEFLHAPKKPHWTIGEGVNIGRNVRLGDYVVIEAGNTIIHDGCMIGNYVLIRPPTRLAENVNLGHGSIIEGHVNIGYHCRIGPYAIFPYHVTIEDHVFIGGNFHYANDPRMKWGRSWMGDELEPLLIKRGARIGVRCTVMPGVTIGENSFVAGGSLLTKDVPDKTIVRGSPAKVIGEVPEDEWI